jgi:hypothetical protein
MLPDAGQPSIRATLMEPAAVDRKPLAFGFRQILVCLPQARGRNHLRARTIKAY